MTNHRRYKAAKGHIEGGSSKVMIVARLPPNHFKAVAEYALSKNVSAAKVIAACVAKCIELGHLPVQKPLPTPKQRFIGSKTRACIAAWADMPPGTYTFYDIARHAKKFWPDYVCYADAANAYRNHAKQFEGSVREKDHKGRVTITKVAP